MKHALTDLLMLISDHGSIVASKIVNSIGALSIGSGVTLGAVAVSAPQVVSQQSALPTIAAAVSIIGGLTFIAKNLFDMWLSWRKRDKN
jgi:hypothetical protein